MPSPSTEPTSRISASNARRLLMHGQGLLNDPGRKASPAAVYKCIERMGYVQVDTINIIERAHHHILMTRLDGYGKPMLRKLLETDRRLFEHWTHDAALIPAKWLRYWHHRWDRFARGLPENAWWKKRIGPDPDAVIAHVLERIEAEGPLMSKDFQHDPRHGQFPGAGPWWGWKPQKAALEYLWWTGRLAVAGRINFHKKYDLLDRVFPNHAHDDRPARQETIDWACRSALERLGTATPGELAEFWKAMKPADAKAWCDAAAKRGEVEIVEVGSEDGSRPRKQYALPDWRKRLRSARVRDDSRMRLMSPFDPVIRDRKRLRRLFGFDYAFEAFVPEKKRTYGYYVLPILQGDRFIGRLDPKFHRDRGELKVRKVWWEDGVKPTKANRAALEAAVDLLARQIGAEKWSLPKRA